jgi:hypothetical protein
MLLTSLHAARQAERVCKLAAWVPPAAVRERLNEAGAGRTAGRTACSMNAARSPGGAVRHRYGLSCRYFLARSSPYMSTHSNRRIPFGSDGGGRRVKLVSFAAVSHCQSVDPAARSATSLVGYGFIRRSAVPTAQRWPVQSAVRSSVPARDGGLRLLVALYGAAAAAVVGGRA